MEQDVALLTELVQGLTDDVAELKKAVANAPQPLPPPDLRPTLDRVAGAIVALREKVEQANQPKAASVVDLSPIRHQLAHLQQMVQHSPAQRMSQAVQWGAGLLFVSLLTTGVGSYWAMKWKDERDRYEVSDWQWRGVRQMYPEVHRKVGQLYADSADYFQARTVELEQAEAARLNAAAWSEKAKQLEGRKRDRR